jgi:hypothetical protein
MIRKRIGRIARFLRKPEHSVIDARLHKALSLCIKASDLGLVTIVSPEESSARLGQAIDELRGLNPERVYSKARQTEA